MTGFYTSSDDVVVLNERIEELARIRQGYAVHLGSSLYDVTKNDPELRWGRESLYDGIADCDAERESLLARIAELESEGSTDAASEVEIDVIEEVVVEDEDAVIVPDEVVEEPSDEVEPETVEEPEPAFVPSPEPAPEFVPEPALEPEPEPEPAPEFVPAPAPEPVQDSAAAPADNTCGVCGSPIADGDKFCMVCGSPVTPPAPSSIDADQTASIPLDATVVKPLVKAPAAEKPQGPTCPKCGASVSEGDKFCMECGSSLAAAPKPNVCPACGSAVDPSFKFCMTCGHKLR